MSTPNKNITFEKIQHHKQIELTIDAKQSKPSRFVVKPIIRAHQKLYSNKLRLQKFYKFLLFYNYICTIESIT